MDGTEYITLKEAGEISGYSPDYIGQLIRRGKLTGKQVYANVAWVTTKEALRGYLEEKGKTKKSEEEHFRPASHSVPPAPLSLEVQKEESITPLVGEEGPEASSRVLSEVKKWEQLLRTLSFFIIIATSLFLMLLLHVFSTLLDDRLERRALEEASAVLHSSHL